MGVPIELTWEVLSLYESVMGRVRIVEGDSKLIESTIGMKQGSPFPQLSLDSILTRSKIS